MDFNHLHLYVPDLTAFKHDLISQWGGQLQAQFPSHHPSNLLIRLGQVPLLISTPAHADAPEATFLANHPAGLGDVAFRVKDLDRTVQQVLAAGGNLIQPIRSGPNRRFRWCQIQGWGNLRHSLIESDPTERWIPGLANPVPLLNQAPPSDQPAIDIRAIDHVVLNVPAGQLEPAAHWYQRQLGFQTKQQFLIDTNRSGLRSLVLAHPQGQAQLPINEPTTPNSQIQEFLTWNRGAGIQHVALRTADIIGTIDQLKQAGVKFLQVPTTYYDDLKQRLNNLPGPVRLDALQQQQILVDWELNHPQAQLFQTFSQPIFGIPTLFFELIQRQLVTVDGQQRLAEGFGEGNFRALFEAIEREQIKRGSLKTNDSDAKDPTVKNYSPTTGSGK